MIDNSLDAKRALLAKKEGVWEGLAYSLTTQNHIYRVSSTVYSLSREFKFSQSVCLCRILETELINYSKTMDFVETNPFETGNFVCRSTHPTLVAANFVFFLNGILETNAVFVVVVCFS